MEITFLRLYMLVATLSVVSAQNVLTFDDLPLDAPVPPCYSSLNFYDFNVTSLKGTMYDDLGNGNVIMTPSLNNITANSSLDGPVWTQQPTTPTIDSCSDTFTIQSLYMACSTYLSSPQSQGSEGCLVYFSCYRADGTVDKENCSSPVPHPRETFDVVWEPCTFNKMNNCVAVLIDVDPASLYISETNNVPQPQQLLVTNVTLPG